MSTIKPAMTISALAFALIFGGGLYVFTHLGDLSRSVSEKVATKALGVPVTIDRVEVSLPQKKAVVSGITVDNPPGFKGPYAVKVRQVDIGLNTVSERLIDFSDIVVRGTDVQLEVTPGGTNLMALRAGMKKVDEPAKADAPSKLAVRIANLALEEGTVHPRITLPMAGEVKSMALPNIKLTNIGQKSGGITATDAIQQIWAQLSQKINYAAYTEGYLTGLSDEALGAISKDGVQGVTDRIMDETKGALDGLGDRINSLWSDE